MAKKKIRKAKFKKPDLKKISLKKNLDKNIQEIEKWIYERKKFFWKLFWIIVLIIILIIISNYLAIKGI